MIAESTKADCMRKSDGGHFAWVWDGRCGFGSTVANKMVLGEFNCSSRLNESTKMDDDSDWNEDSDTK